MRQRTRLAIVSTLARIVSVLLALLLATIALGRIFTMFYIVVGVAEPQQVTVGVGMLLCLALMVFCTWWVTRR